MSISKSVNKLSKDKNIIIYSIIQDERKDGASLLKKYISSLFCVAVFYSKKGLLKQQIMNVNALNKNFTYFDKSKMVVFNVNRNNKDAVLNELYKHCMSCGHYGPIVEVEERDIYFFPRLNYGDAYLIKDLFKNKFLDKKINVFFGRLAI